ncbi:type II secretion system F family protein [Streptacidiphilus rugosus]|uniref:type II secretion system F family protein n=1 Tax=Streptacidiphilus rugosus TaxID=405783 RepID=UPI00056BE6F7|nr:type II secretion system F family protein [Streptacidiphilus rugosus]
MTLLVLFLSAAVGGGVWTAVTALRPQRVRLAVEVARLTTPAPAAPSSEATVASPQVMGIAEGWAGRLGSRLAPALSACGLPGPKVRADLAALGKPAERHLAEKALAALLGLVTPWPLCLAISVLGIQPGWTAPAGLAVLLGAAGFLAPDLALRSTAAEWRHTVRHALSAWLDMTGVALSGGAGVEQALRDAAMEGEGEAFDAFRLVLRAAEITRTPPWDRLRDLGLRLGVTDLDELACSIALAGGEGARVRNTLMAKASSLRAHLLADAEAAVSSATERMAIPVALMMTGFLGILAYPSLANAMQSL